MTSLNDDPDDPDDPDDMGEQAVEQHYYVLHDRQYSILALVDGTGRVQEHYEYTPYGERQCFRSLSSTKDPYCLTPFAIVERKWVGSVIQPYGRNPFGFQGLMHDEETGLVYNRARMLNPRLKRFMQRDPAGYPDGLNGYAAYHVLRGRLDPYGLEITEEGLLETYETIFGEDDPWLEAFYAHPDNEISIEGVLGQRDTDQHWFATSYQIEIEEDLESYIEAAFYFREMLIKTVSICPQSKEHYLEASGWDAWAWQRLQREAMRAAVEQSALIANIYLSGIGIVSEGADVVISLGEISQGNYAAAVGLIPFVPTAAGSSFKMVARVNGKLIEFGKISGTRGLRHSYDRHAAQWFSRHGGRQSMQAWEEVCETASRSTKIFEWSTGGSETIAQLARIDGNKWFVIQFFKDGDRAGEIATAFIPNQQQLNAMLEAIGH